MTRLCADVTRPSRPPRVFWDDRSGSVTLGSVRRRLVLLGCCLIVPACSLLFDGEPLGSGRTASAGSAGEGGAAGSAGSTQAGAGGSMLGGAGGSAGQGGAAGLAGSGGSSGSGGSGAGGSAGSAGSAGSSSGPGRCQVARDDFEDGTLDAALFPYGDGTAVESGGVLTLSVDPTKIASTGVLTDVVDVRDCYVAAKIDPFESGGVTNSFTMEPVPFVADSNVRIRLTNTTLSWGVVALNTAPYDSTQHRWWRIRNAAGTTHFEASPDGVTWNELGTAPTPAPLSAARVFVNLNSWQMPRAASLVVDDWNH